MPLLKQLQFTGLQASSSQLNPRQAALWGEVLCRFRLIQITRPHGDRDE